MKPTTTLPIGYYLVLHEGEYSDKLANGPYKLLKPFNLDEANKEFLVQWDEYEHETYEEYPSPNNFVTWLFKEGYIDDVENVAHMFIGSYGEYSARFMR